MLLQVYLLQIMYMTFHYLTVSCMSCVSVPDSFVYAYYRSCIWHFSSWLFCVCLLQVMYMTFHYLTVLCMPTTGHVYDISVPDSFVYAYYRSCIWHFRTRQFCVCLLQVTYDISVPDSFVYAHVHDISLPDSFVYAYYRSCIWHFTTWQFCVCLLQVMYMRFLIVPNICYLGINFLLGPILLARSLVLRPSYSSVYKKYFLQ